MCYSLNYKCKCGERFTPLFGDVFSLDFQACPTCGEPKERFENEISRFISTSKWYKLSSWGSGYWDVKRSCKYK